MNQTPHPDPNERPIFGLDPAPDPMPDPTPDQATLHPNPGDAPTISVTVSDPLGLHLRSGRELVRVASQFDAHITAQNVSRSSEAVDAKSILQLMQLQARRGHVLQISAHGPDADQAVAALSALFV
jgi:phosphotransferase system HPr (HPr) family protein